MNALTQAIYTLLSSSSDLTNRISTYQNAPAIFTGDFVPENANAPWVYIPPAISDVRADTKTYNGREIEIDVGVWGSQSAGSKDVEDIAEVVRGLLHRASFSVSGYDLIECLANGVVGVPGEVDLIGRVVMLHVWIVKQ